MATVMMDARKLYGRIRVPIKEIRIDERYQRDPGTEKEIKTLAERWDDRAASVITLSLRDDGLYYCIDGQRRVAAARLIKGDDAELEAQVWIDMSPAEEAGLFSQLQEGKKLTPLDRFKADIFSGKREALDIRDIVRRCGYEVRASHGNATLSISAVAVLRRVYRDFGATGLDRVLRVLHQSGDEKGPAGEAIEGMYLFLHRYTHADESRVIEVLKRCGFTGMLRKSADQRAAQPRLSGGSAWGRALLMEYNKGLRTNDLGEWRDRPKGGQ